MTRHDAAQEAKRARGMADAAAGMAQTRRRAYELAETQCAPAAELAVALEGAELAAREHRFWVAQSVRYAEIAGEPVKLA